MDDVYLPSLPGGAWKGREFTYGYNDGAWNAKTLTSDTAGNLATPRILRNSPAACVVRCSYQAKKFDIALRRGEGFFTISITNPTNPVTRGDGFATSVAVASTAFTGGLAATSADANGQKYLMSTPAAGTRDVVNGRLFATPLGLTSTQFQIAADYLGAGFATDTVTRDLFLAGGAESHRVVLG